MARFRAGRLTVGDESRPVGDLGWWRLSSLDTGPDGTLVEWYDRVDRVSDVGLASIEITWAGTP